LNDILTALVPLVVLLIGYATTQLQKYLKGKVSGDQFAALAGISATIVEGIEQLDKKSGALTSEQKYQLAARTLRDAAKKVGVKLSDEEVSAFIHSAVRLVKAENPFSATS